MAIRERKIEKYLKSEILKHFPNALVEKWGIRGNPDQVVFITGAVYFVEVKTSDGCEQSNQSRQIKRIRETQNNVSTVRGHKGVDEFITILKEHHTEFNIYLLSPFEIYI